MVYFCLKSLIMETSKFITVYRVSDLYAGNPSIVVANVPAEYSDVIYHLYGNNPALHIDHHNYKHNVKFSNK